MADDNGQVGQEGRGRQGGQGAEESDSPLVASAELKAIVEALIFASPEPLSFKAIAKLLDTKPTEGASQTTTLMLTTDYASPEQIRGEPVTTATDVYSLGAVLYEVLTGQRAHRFSTNSPSEYERVICHIEPVRPSQITAAAGPPVRNTRSLAGDLDNIILMALRKEPERRYSSVEQFSEDIQRYLDGFPVRARDATIRYRIGKFARRHRLGVAATTLIAASLIGGALLTGWQARRAALAERQRMIGDAKDVERQLLDKARADALKKVEAARAELAANEASVRGQLQASGKELARTIASKILSREVA